MTVSLKRKSFFSTNFLKWNEKNAENELRIMKDNELSVRENDEKLQEMMMKNESLESMNKKLLSELVSIQTEKSEIKSQLNSMNITIDEMKKSMKLKEKILNDDLLKKCWHFLRKFLSYNLVCYTLDSPILLPSKLLLIPLKTLFLSKRVFFGPLNLLFSPWWKRKCHRKRFLPRNNAIISLE